MTDPSVSAETHAQVAAGTQVQASDPSIPAKTTFQEDLVTASQRKINLIWEATQALIAVSITFGVIYCSIVKTASEVLTNAFFLIVGFYFSRTNHAAIGGVGSKPMEPYTGR